MLITALVYIILDALGIIEYARLRGNKCLKIKDAS